MFHEVQLPELIIGAEGDGQEPTPPDGGNDASDQGGNSQDNQHDDSNDPKVKGLKSALDTERANNRSMAAELKKLKSQRDAEELSKKTELEQAQIAADAASKRSQKLAEAFLTAELKRKVSSEAAKAQFIDPEDAITGVDLSSLTYEQDEEDPSRVTIDEKSVREAVKSLAARKPHYIKKGTDDGGPSGSQFGGAGKGKKSTTADELRQKYPGL